MKKNNKEPKEAAESRESRLKRRFTVENEGRLYFVLQLVFAFAQILLAYVAFIEKNYAYTATIAVIALFGALMMLMAGRGWQVKGFRILGRAIALILPAFILVAITGTVLFTRVTQSAGFAYASRAWTDYVGQFGAYLVLDLQPFLLLFFPTFAIAARRIGKQEDIFAVRLLSWCNFFTALVTLLLSYESAPTRLDYSNSLLFLSNRALLFIYLVCTAASVFAVFMSYPYGTKWLMKKIEAARSGKAADTAENTAEPSAEAEALPEDE